VEEPDFSLQFGVKFIGVEKLGNELKVLLPCGKSLLIEAVDEEGGVPGFEHLPWGIAVFDVNEP